MDRGDGAARQEEWKEIPEKIDGLKEDRKCGSKSKTSKGHATYADNPML